MDLGLLESLSLLTVIAWGVLICCRGDFWRARERLDGPPGTLSEWPSVAVLIPARDEAAVIG